MCCICYKKKGKYAAHPGYECFVTFFVGMVQPVKKYESLSSLGHIARNCPGNGSGDKVLALPPPGQ